MSTLSSQPTADLAEPATDSRPSRNRRRLLVIVGLLAVPVILMALGAACSGGSASPGVADIESTPGAGDDSADDDSSGSNDSSEPDVLAYSQCMRANGIPNFPDPNSEGGLAIDANTLGIEPDSPQFKAADEACKDLLPAPDEGQRPDRETMLKYAQCMRDQGISDFPDPPAGDGPNTQSQSGQHSDLDPNSPQFQAADEACKHYLPDGGEGRILGQSGGGE